MNVLASEKFSPIKITFPIEFFNDRNRYIHFGKSGYKMDTYRKQIEEMEEKEKAAKEVLAKHDLRAETFKIISFVEFIKSLAPKSIYDQKASSKGIISV